jgi:hypothetical protein
MSDNDLIKAIVGGLGSEALRVLLTAKERHSLPEAIDFDRWIAETEGQKPKPYNPYNINFGRPDQMSEQAVHKLKDCNHRGRLNLACATKSVSNSHSNANNLNGTTHWLASSANEA